MKKLLKPLFVALVISSFSYAAEPFMSRSASQVEILKQNPDGSLTTKCIGTIFEASKIITSATCFDDKDYRAVIRYNKRLFTSLMVFINSRYDESTAEQATAILEIAGSISREAIVGLTPFNPAIKKKIMYVGDEELNFSDVKNSSLANLKLKVNQDYLPGTPVWIRKYGVWKQAGIIGKKVDSERFLVEKISAGKLYGSAYDEYSSY